MDFFLEFYNFSLIFLKFSSNNYLKFVDISKKKKIKETSEKN